MGWHRFSQGLAASRGYQSGDNALKGITNVIGYVIFWLIAASLTFGTALIAMGVLLFLTFAGADERKKKAEKLVQTTLMADETVVAQAIQHRVFALFYRRMTIAITNSRIIIIKRGVLGGFKMSDIQWKDLKDAKIEQNVMESICGSNLSFSHYNASAGQFSVPGVNSDVASTIYKRAQSEEQAWEEKRRVRAMEEVRAAAGGVVVHTSQAPAAAPAAPVGNRMLSEITEAKKLLDAGVISDAEFQEMKSKILAAA
jgi:hypothetical protein